MRSIAILCDKGPFGTNSANEAMRLGAGFMALGEEIKCKVIFYGDGVYIMKKGLNPSIINVDSIEDGIEMAQLSELPILLVKEDIEERGIKQQDLVEYENLEIITRNQVSKILLEFPAAFKV